MICKALWVFSLLLLFQLRLDACEFEGYRCENIHGWQVLFEDRLQEDQVLYQQVSELIEADLIRINRTLPKQALQPLHEVRIWVDLEHPLFPGCVYHPSEVWLRENNCHIGLTKSVHIANVQNYLEWTKHQPAMILHELAHAYHHQILGYEHQEIIQAYQNASEGKSYESVLRYDGETARAYALSNEQEYFAELSEAYFWSNDFYPFVKAEVKKHDPAMFKLLEQLWCVH